MKIVPRPAVPLHGLSPAPVKRRRDDTTADTEATPTFVNPRDCGGSYAPDFILQRSGSDLSPGAKLVYIVLLRHYNLRSKKAYPGEERIGRSTGLSARQVRRHIGTLKKLGLIHVTATGRSNNYRFPWHPWMKNAGLRPKVITERAE
jgi:hypothetical protein